MDKITNLHEKLVPNLPFDDVWSHKDEDGTPVSEVGYIRADHDGHRWWNTCWRKHRELESPEITAEIDALYEAFKEMLPDLPTMTNWCWHNARRVSDDEFNAYYVGVYGCYWLRMITRRRDYNLYLHCYSKAAMERGDNA